MADSAANDCVRPTIGIISFGDMGSGLARLLIAHDYTVMTNLSGRRRVPFRFTIHPTNTSQRGHSRPRSRGRSYPPRNRHRPRHPQRRHLVRRASSRCPRHSTSHSHRPHLPPSTLQTPLLRRYGKTPLPLNQNTSDTPRTPRPPKPSAQSTPSSPPSLQPTCTSSMAPSWADHPFRPSQTSLNRLHPAKTGHFVPCYPSQAQSRFPTAI